MPEKSGSISIVSYVINGLLIISGVFFIYQIIVNSGWTFAPEWNMFKSGILGSICVVIGFFLAMIKWGKGGHWSSTPVIEKRDSYTGRVIERKEDFDITEQVFAKIFLPLLGHFVIEPLMYGAFIYYPITCIIWLVGSIFPYILSFIIVVIIVALWLLCNSSDVNKNIIIYSVISFLLTVGFSYGGYYIYKGVTPVYNVTTPSYQTQQSDKFDGGEFDNDEIDESEFE